MKICLLRAAHGEPCANYACEASEHSSALQQAPKHEQY